MGLAIVLAIVVTAASIGTGKWVAHKFKHRNDVIREKVVKDLHVESVSTKN